MQERTLPFLFYMPSIMLILELNKDSHVHTKKENYVCIYHKQKYKCLQQTTSKASARIHDNHMKFIQGAHGWLSIKKHRSLGILVIECLLGNMCKALGSISSITNIKRIHSKILLKNSKNQIKIARKSP